MGLLKSRSSAKLSDFPVGTCVYDGSKHWYLQGKYKRAILTKRVFKSWDFPFVVKVSPEFTASLLKAKPLKFRNGTVIRAMDGKAYVISEGKRRLIANPDYLSAFGLKLRDIEYVSNVELELHELGEDLN